MTSRRGDERIREVKPIQDMTGQEIARIRGVLFDIDDTFTLHGRVIPEAFSVLWELHDKGFILVPITGRPAGWCDHIARMWPVDAVVGENGAFYYCYSEQDRRLLRRYVFAPEQTQEKRHALERIREEVMSLVPGAGIAADQPFRLFDLAVDFAEDVPPLSQEEIQGICNIFSSHHANYKVSSIHVNGWFGDYNKLLMTRLFLEERLGLAWEDARDRFIFIGDSPNDEPMLEAFPVSIGVANVERFIPMMKHPPAYITKHDGGSGFAEAARIILAGGSLREPGRTGVRG
jgi:HAD superfamily hydrolase (TIGR01484 family)